MSWALLGCSSDDRRDDCQKDQMMVQYERPGRLASDASEVPGAVVIHPERNPNMVYDPETERVTDTETGQSFGAARHMRSGGIYAAGIKRSDGSYVGEYELRRQEIRHPDGAIKRVVWQVFWARRGDWMERFAPSEIGLGKAHALAEAEALNDSLDRLGQFLRAKREGISLMNKGRIIGEVVIVDRRMDDTRSERIW